MKKIIQVLGLTLAFVALSNSAQAETCAVMYEHANYQGASYVIGGNSSNSWIGDWWNDRVSSATVLPGCHLTMYQHANFEGTAMNYNNNVSYVGDSFNDQASSFDCFCR